MEPHNHLAVALYNLTPLPQAVEYFTSETLRPLRSNRLPILRRTETAITVYGPDEFDDHVKIHIGSVQGLSNGQLSIDAPHLLNNKTWCVQLPRTRALNLGLTLIISKPGQVQNITASYAPFTPDSCATLQIAMPLPAEHEPVGTLTYEIGTNKKPILTEINVDDPQGRLMLMARVFAFEGAYASA